MNQVAGDCPEPLRAPNQVKMEKAESAESLSGEEKFFQKFGLQIRGVHEDRDHVGRENLVLGIDRLISFDSRGAVSRVVDHHYLLEDSLAAERSTEFLRVRHPEPG